MYPNTESHFRAEIEALRQQLADSQKREAMLHFELFASANYIDTLGGSSVEARRALVATEPKP